jgi:hypothetical protein
MSNRHGVPARSGDAGAKQASASFAMPDSPLNTHGLRSMPKPRALQRERGILRDDAGTMRVLSAAVFGRHGKNVNAGQSTSPAFGHGNRRSDLRRSSGATRAMGTNLRGNAWYGSKDVFGRPGKIRMDTGKRLRTRAAS